MSLFYRLFLSIVGLALLAVVTLGLTAYLALENTRFNSEYIRLKASASLLAETFEGYLESARSDVRAFAALPGVTELFTQRPTDSVARTDEELRRAQDVVRALLQAKPQYLQLRVISADAQGREIVRAERDAPAGPVSVVPEAGLQDKGDRDYVRQSLGLERGDIYVSPLNLNQEFGVVEIPPVPVLRVVTPVNAAASPNGLSVINIDMRTTLAELGRSLPPPMQVFMVNSDGDFLIHPDASKTFGFDLGQRHLLSEDFKLPGILDTLAADGPTLLETVDAVDGVDWSMSGVRLPLDGDRWVAVFVGERRTDILEGVRRSLFPAVIAAGPVLLLTAFVAFFVARSMAMPISNVARSIVAYDNGQARALPKKVPPELVELVATFESHFKRRDLFNALVQSSLDAIVTTTRDGTITSWNSAAEHLYGMSAADVQGKRLDIVVPEARRADFAAAMQRALHGEVGEVSEDQRKTAWNSVIEVSYSLSPIRSILGDIIGLADISRDISEVRQAQEQFRLAVEASPAGMLIVAGDGTIVSANAAAAEMFGYGRTELAGRRIESLVPDDTRSGHPALRESYMSAPSQRMMGRGRDLRGLRADGRSFPVEVGLNPFETTQGPRVLSVVVDITERRQIDEERHRFTEELQRSNEELQRFAYVASHDLQEPLRMVVSFCTLLKERYAGSLDTTGVEFLDFAVDGAQRMRQLIDDLLEYSRLQTADRRREPFPIGLAVNRALQGLSVSIAETKAEIELGELPTVVGDLPQIARVFQNLIGNALKFRGQSTPVISITSERDGQKTTISVSDNGIGIPAGMEEAIFEVFKRLHTRGDYPGTGMGLAICRRIVEQHGGRLWYEHRDGGGSRFCMSLPTAPVAPMGEVT